MKSNIEGISFAQCIIPRKADRHLNRRQIEFSTIHNSRQILEKWARKHSDVKNSVLPKRGSNNGVEIIPLFLLQWLSYFYSFGGVYFAICGVNIRIYTSDFNSNSTVDLTAYFYSPYESYFNTCGRVKITS